MTRRTTVGNADRVALRADQRLSLADGANRPWCMAQHGHAVDRSAPRSLRFECLWQSLQVILLGRLRQLMPNPFGVQ